MDNASADGVSNLRSNKKSGDKVEKCRPEYRLL